MCLTGISRGYVFDLGLVMDETLESCRSVLLRSSKKKTKEVTHLFGSFITLPNLMIPIYLLVCTEQKADTGAFTSMQCI